MNQLRHNNKNNKLHILNSRENNIINLEDDDFYLTEEDFYPPSDDRVLKAGIYQIKNDVSFEEYTEYIFDLYEREKYYEN